MREASERDLVARLGTDPAAFEEFYRRHVDAVTLFAVRRVGPPDQAADLVAEVFLEVIESAGRYDPRRGEPIAWVMGIAVNLVAAQTARVLHEAIARLPEGERELLALVSVDGPTPVEAARALGIHPAAGRMRLARARRKVRAALAEHATATGAGGDPSATGPLACSPFPHG